MNFPFVSIVLPNYNGKEDTLECLESLEHLNYPKEKLEIIVVDNGSQDGSQKKILDFFSSTGVTRQALVYLKADALSTQNFARLRLIQNKKNFGAPAAYNQGIAVASKNYDYIWKLDNDVIVDKNSLFELVEFAENNKKIGMVSGKIYFDHGCHSEERQRRRIPLMSRGIPRSSRYARGPRDDAFGVIWAIGGKINYFLGNLRNVGKNSIDHSMSRFIDDRTKIQKNNLREKYHKIRKDFDFLPGCALLIKKEVIKKIGLFDEEYFIYYDEADLCVRAKNAGYDLVFVPKAIIFHKASKTTREGSFFKNYYLTRNKILFLRKFKKSIFFPILFTLGFEIWHRWLLRSKVTDLPNILKGVVKGIKNGLKNN